MNISLKIPLLFCLCLGAGLWNTRGYAQIPPSQFIVKTWVKKHSDTKAVKIKTLITAMEDGKPGVRSEETLFSTLTLNP